MFFLSRQRPFCKKKKHTNNLYHFRKSLLALHEKEVGASLLHTRASLAKSKKIEKEKKRGGDDKGDEALVAPPSPSRRPPAYFYLVKVEMEATPCFLGARPTCCLLVVFVVCRCCCCLGGK